MAAHRRCPRGERRAVPRLPRVLLQRLLFRMKRVEEKRMCHFRRNPSPELPLLPNVAQPPLMSALKTICAVNCCGLRRQNHARLHISSLERNASRHGTQRNLRACLHDRIRKPRPSPVFASGVLWKRRRDRARTSEDGHGSRVKTAVDPDNESVLGSMISACRRPVDVVSLVRAARPALNCRCVTRPPTATRCKARVAATKTPPDARFRRGFAPSVVSHVSSQVSS
jgi:hypothetical protein